MIAVVTGPPGAGKTYYTVRKIEEAVRAGRYVATNVRLADDWAERIADGTVLRVQRRKRARRIAEWRSRVIYVEDYLDLARLRLGPAPRGSRVEGRGLAIFDEAGDELDARDSMSAAVRERRRQVNRFARQHRKLGWDFLLIAQEAEQIDARVRGMAEYEVRLRNLRRFKVLGVPVAPVNVFLAVWSWSAPPTRNAMKRETFLLSRRIAGLYNTHQIVQAVNDDASLPLPAPHAPAGPMLTVQDLDGGLGVSPSSDAVEPGPDPDARELTTDELVTRHLSPPR